MERVKRCIYCWKPINNRAVKICDGHWGVLMAHLECQLKEQKRGREHMKRVKARIRNRKLKTPSLFKD